MIHFDWLRGSESSVAGTETDPKTDMRKHTITTGMKQKDNRGQQEVLAHSVILGVSV